MVYSSAGILALIIQLIINHEVLWNKAGNQFMPARAEYRRFVVSVTVYFAIDALWGILYEFRLVELCYADTVLYFASMALTILLWTRYVIAYLRERTLFRTLLLGVGGVLFLLVLIILVVNLFTPVLFTFTPEGTYVAETARYVMLVVQMAMFFMTVPYVLGVAGKGTQTMRLRYYTIGFSSLNMALFILLQAIYPLLPMYAVGCLVSCCILHSFVLENEKDEYRDNLEVRLQENVLKGNYYDLLTGLPGMSYFFQLVERKREQMLDRGIRSAYLYLNLSGMKFYNQSRGFTEGDRLLRNFSALLTTVFGEENCSRFGQDHFAVFTGAEGVEERLNGLFEAWEKTREESTPTILAGIYPGTGEEDISAACDRAKIACDAVRTGYVSSYLFFNSDMYASAEKEQYIIAHLDQAIAGQWIKVYYQPIIRATNDRICDEEALARWVDPKRGTLSPGEFIPILENARIIYKMDLYVVNQVLLKIRRMCERGQVPVPQSVNLSRSDFDECDIVEEIRKRVDLAGVPRRLITIEITESIIGTDFEFIRRQAARFRELGFPVWMDDFGSGYSSLDVLQSMPVDLIKLDMRFMQQFDDDEKSRIILTELMKMAIGLGIDTVCEGVERADQVEFLKEIGCTRLQGFYYTQPLPEEELEKAYQSGSLNGYEKPDEVEYFNALGRISLYDLTGLVKDDASLRRYFNTVPMAIIEVNGDETRIARCNLSYREFTADMFSVDATGLSTYQATEKKGRDFSEALQKCVREEERGVYDLKGPDGRLVHLLLRRIARNPVTGTEAVAVAVLSVSDGPVTQ
ncbi:MAG: EAL domain-containing protein [Clostridia bacterium]|nr:EAL domain-containing protein [Clostridia bacterium]